MKKIVALLIPVLICISAFCDEGWSNKFRFDGSDVTEEAVLLNPTDPIAYSTELSFSKPVSLIVFVEDQNDIDIGAFIFEDNSGNAVEGITYWDYTEKDYADFPPDDTYILSETIVTEYEVTFFKRAIKIIPEPATLIAVILFGALFLKKRAGALAAMLAVVAFGSIGALADGCVSDVNCLQMWPFEKFVIINYTLASDKTDQLFALKFYGSLDGGKTTFDLAEKGLLDLGKFAGPGRHKTIWTPDESMRDVLTEEMMIKVEANKIPQSKIYLVVDLSGGPGAKNFPVSYLDDIPEGGWTEEYKTTKLVLRRIDQGTFIMGPVHETVITMWEYPRKVAISTPFYAGVFQVTQEQYRLVTGSSPSRFFGDMRPVDSVSYDMIRGVDKGARWPQSNEVDDDSFIGILRAKTNLTFDLPTEAQWEYACRAGTQTALNNGKELTSFDYCKNMDEVGRYDGNKNDGKGGYKEHTVVGMYRPNAWGLYDMHGNVWESCLDWHLDWEKREPNLPPVVDPLGPEKPPRVGNARVMRGGAYYTYALYCRSTHLSWSFTSKIEENHGFRLVMNPYTMH